MIRQGLKKAKQRRFAASYLILYIEAKRRCFAFFITKKEEDKSMTEEIMEALNGQVFGVWFLIGAALVFWMQAGFAMVEAGFTRAKTLVTLS